MKPSKLALWLVATAVSTFALHANAACRGAWAEGNTYQSGDTVTYSGATYTALVTHTAYVGTNWNPAATATLWQSGGSCGTAPTPAPTPSPQATPTPRPTTAPQPTPTPSTPSTCTSAPAWTASGVYNGGARVSHQGTVYEAKWWTQGDNPAQSGEWGVWKVVGTCSGSSPTPTKAPVPTPTKAPTPQPTAAPTPNPGVPVPSGWRLVWNDEFNGSSIDGSKWGFEVNAQGGGNNELQYYTSRAENARIENGKLVIEARRENYTGSEGTRQYTSARLRTLGKGDWTYGRFEARMKLPYGQGLWPAFWMLPTDWVYGGWAASGEIDIMEAVNLKAAGGNNVYGTIHYGGAWPANTYKTISTVPNSSAADNFHDYAVEWEPGVIRWYVDGQFYGQQTDWYSTAGAYPAPFNQRFHLILNVAVGGNWPGNPDASSPLPQKMEVDWVRVFQR
ncbi:carbohydrate-binding protein [Chitinolyticbacter meiyuanensis]|uniref:carbohydrate-binding protein n=1 Tax=Chitinolyticbacter meiyuanensis TaxID=682798 RepID=UPI0011E5EF2E|nr:family 16 glycosylhydrolase [Chitinolyticbacter meiyuanensis]